MDKLKIFQKWEERASVRNAPRRVVTTKESSAKFFSARLAPILSHPLVNALSEKDQRKIEIQFLYRYLKFTEYLETSLVNKVIVEIMNDDLLVKFSKNLKDKAYKIYCDEAYHALQAHDTMQQVEAMSGEAALRLENVLSKRLSKLREETPKQLLGLFELFFVCISETLVSQELREHIKDKEIEESIQEIMRDHANDEAIHALFFKEIMLSLKRELPSDDFRWFIDMIPQFLDAYLIPDPGNLTLIFEPYLSSESIKTVLEEALSEEKMEAFVVDASVQLRRILNCIESQM